MYKHLVVNAFPRSGSVYFASLLGVHEVSGAQYTSLHLPYIIGNENVKNIVVVRDPYECIASLFYKELNHQRKHQHTETDCWGCRQYVISVMDLGIKDHVEEYIQYIDRCIEFNGSDNLYIVDFNKMKEDPVKELKNVVSKFGLTAREINSSVDVYSMIENSMSSNGMIDDSGGHMPRAKKDLREFIDKKIYEYTDVIEAYDKYRHLIMHIKN